MAFDALPHPQEPPQGQPSQHGQGDTFFGIGAVAGAVAIGFVLVSEIARATRASRSQVTSFFPASASATRALRSRSASSPANSPPLTDTSSAAMNTARITVFVTMTG